MKKACMLLAALSLASAASPGRADEIRLKDGTVYEGDILFWNDMQYAISVNGKALCVNIGDIRSLRIDNPARMNIRPKNVRKA